MKINLFTTCVNYTDYLQTTLPYNLSLFDKIYIVTSSSDTVTQEYCKQYDKVHLEITDSFYNIPNYFNKGKALNEVLKYIEPNTWSVIGDADCIYPSCLKDIIYTPIEIKSNLFGMRRIICESKEQLKNIMDIANKHSNHPMVLREHPFNGYCQIFNSSSIFLNKNKIMYNESAVVDSNGELTTNCHDKLFREIWPYDNRTLLDGIVVHLGPIVVNWKGRKSKAW